MRTKPKTVRELTDDELKEKLPNQCDVRYDHSCCGRSSCSYTEADVVKELWRRYEELKGEWFAKRENL